MATVVNNPSGNTSDSNMGAVLAVIVFVILFFVLIMYGLPRLRSGGTSVNVPDKVDVNLNQPQAPPAQ